MTRLLRHRAEFVLVLAGLAPGARADATLHYHTEVQANAVIPAAPLDQAVRGMRDVIIRTKGNKTYSSQGTFISIVDATTQEFTVVDPAHKRFVAVSPDQFANQLKAMLPVIPEQTRAIFASMKTNVESRDTGRTAAILGIQAEEHEFALTVSLALPGGPPNPAPVVKTVIQIWTAKPEEIQRIPALSEFKSYRTIAGAGMNPAEMIKQLLGAMPGMAENMGSLAEEMSRNGGVPLRVHTEVLMPLLAVMSRQLPQQPGRTLPQDLDPNAPMMQMNQELVELSSNPLDDALFVVPADYQPASLEEILKGIASTPPQIKP